MACKLAAFRLYAKSFLAILLPAVCKVELSRCCRDLALLILGSTGEGGGCLG